MVSASDVGTSVGVATVCANDVGTSVGVATRRTVEFGFAFWSVHCLWAVGRKEIMLQKQ